MFVAEGESLVDAVRRSQPELVIVDMASPDRDGLDSVQVLNAAQSLPVVLFVDDDDPDFMEEAIASGVISYHVHGAALPAIKPLLRTASALFRRTAALTSQLAEARELIAVRDKIDAAKRLLITQDGMTEPAAHRFLQRRAMDSQRKMVDIAEDLLSDRAVKRKPSHE
jgi:response regulator NasT